MSSIITPADTQSLDNNAIPPTQSSKKKLFAIHGEMASMEINYKLNLDITQEQFGESSKISSDDRLDSNLTANLTLIKLK